jgi:hypothetical protein
MLEAVEGELYLLEVLEMPEVMRCMLEAVEVGLCLLEVGDAGGAGDDALCAISVCSRLWRWRAWRR